MALGQLFDFEKGEALGLVNQILGASDGTDFMKQVTEYARQFTTPNKARARRRIKRAVQTALRYRLSQRWRSNANCSSNCFKRKMRRKAGRVRE